MLPVILISACLGEVSSPDEAVKAWGKTMMIVGDGDEALRGNAGEGIPLEDEAPDNMLPYFGTPFPVEGSVACPIEGTAAFTGNYFLNESGAFLGYDYTIDFDGCIIGELQIDGILNVSRDEDIDDVYRTYTGELEWRGEVRGRCPLDWARDYQSGSGNFCGFDAFDVFPGW